MGVPQGLKYSMEELHEMHKRIFLNGVFHWQKDHVGQPLTIPIAENILDDAQRALTAIDNGGWC